MKKISFGPVGSKALTGLKWFFTIPWQYKGMVKGSAGKKVGYGIMFFVWLYFALAPVVMVANYQFAQISDIQPAHGRSAALDTPDYVPGVHYVDALLRCHEEGLKPFLPNDWIYQTRFLDNPQNFQLGVLEGIRDGVRVLRDNFCRQRTVDQRDLDVDPAFNYFAIGADKWIFPRAEDEYAKGAKRLRNYRKRLLNGQARFYPRADNVIECLAQLNSSLGGANMRLYNTIGGVKTRMSEETLGDAHLEGEQRSRIHVPWHQTDDNFYFAQGRAYVIRELMVAISHDFNETLTTRKADEMVAAIVDDFLAYSQFEPWYVANGNFGSIWPNHLYQLLGVTSQVRERMRSLITMLSANVSQG